jgi:mersacidin/lichenicidin family type 2 lantibiotic
MKTSDIIRAWKDPAFRASLSDEQRAALPKNPAGVVELSDEDLGRVSGGMMREEVTNTVVCDPTIWQKNGGCCANPSVSTKFI